MERFDKLFPPHHVFYLVINRSGSLQISALRATPCLLMTRLLHFIGTQSRRFQYPIGRTGCTSKRQYKAIVSDMRDVRDHEEPPHRDKRSKHFG